MDLEKMLDFKQFPFEYSFGADKLSSGVVESLSKTLVGDTYSQLRLYEVSKRGMPSTYLTDLSFALEDSGEYVILNSLQVAVYLKDVLPKIDLPERSSNKVLKIHSSSRLYENAIPVILNHLCDEK